LLLEMLVDNVYLVVIGDGLERDVRHALVDEALFDVASPRRRRGIAGDAGYFRLLLPARLGIRQQVIGVPGRHKAGAGEAQAASAAATAIIKTVFISCPPVSNWHYAGEPG